MVFILTSKMSENDDGVRNRVMTHFPDGYYEVGRGVWLIAFNGTTKQLYERLFPQDLEGLPSQNGVFVGGITGYYGWSPMDLWEWIRVKTGGSDAG